MGSKRRPVQAREQLYKSPAASAKRTLASGEGEGSDVSKVKSRGAQFMASQFTRRMLVFPVQN